MSIYRGIRYINTCFVSVFRQMFTGHPVYPYTKDWIDSKLWIDEDNARAVEKYPQIIVEDASKGEVFHASFVHNIQKELYELNAETGINEYKGSIHGVPIRPTIAVTITTLNKFDTGAIADEISMWFNQGGDAKFNDAGINIVSISVSAMQKEPYGKEIKYSVILTFNLLCDWQDFKPYDADKIERIEIPSIDAVIVDKDGNITLEDKEKVIHGTNEKE